MNIAKLIDIAEPVQKREAYRLLLTILIQNEHLPDDQEQMLLILDKYKSLFYASHVQGFQARFFQPMMTLAKIKEKTEHHPLCLSIEHYLIVQELLGHRHYLQLPDFDRTEKTIADHLSVTDMFKEVITNSHINVQPDSFFQVLTEYRQDVFGIKSHPLLGEGISILLKSLKEPKYFQDFIQLYEQNPNSFFISSLKNNQEIHQDANLARQVDYYYSHQDKESKRLMYYHDRQTLSLLISEFFLRYPDVYSSRADVLPEAYYFLKHIENRSVINHYTQQFQASHYLSFKKTQTRLFEDFLHQYLFGLFWETQNNQKSQKERGLNINYDHLSVLVKNVDCVRFIQHLEPLDEERKLDNLTFLLTQAENVFKKNIYASFLKNDYSYELLRQTAKTTQLYVKMQEHLCTQDEANRIKTKKI